MYGYLMHFGIKGQKWGVRRYQNPDGTLTDAGKRRYYSSINGNRLTLLKQKVSDSDFYDIYSDKKIGRAIVDNKSDGGSSLDWIGIKSKERRKGYGQEALDLIIDDLKKSGKKYVELEAAGLDPAAKHIYEKKGFKEIKELKDDDFWNGLTLMKKDLTDSVFISGSSKTQDKESGYYRKSLPKDILKEIDSYMKKGDKILVGDAPGIDRQVQDYVNSKGYSNVVVYGPGKSVRYSANKKWKTKSVDAPQYKEMSPEWLREKDIAMTNDSTKGLAIVLDKGGAKATRNNVDRLMKQNKNVKIFEISSEGENYDKYIDKLIKDISH